MRIRGDDAFDSKSLQYYAPRELRDSPSIQPSADPNELSDPPAAIEWRPPRRKTAAVGELPDFLRGDVLDVSEPRPVRVIGKGTFAILAVLAAGVGVAVEVVFFEPTTFAEWRNWAQPTKPALKSVAELPREVRAAQDRVASNVSAPVFTLADASGDANTSWPLSAKVASYDAAAAPPAAASVAPRAVAVPSPSAAPPAPAEVAADAPVARRQLDPKEIAVLLKRAEELMSNGDLPAARLLLQRVAETRNANAAFVLGATYDPIAIKRFGRVSAAPDLELARAWYQRARDWGLPDASKQLDALASAEK